MSGSAICTTPGTTSFTAYMASCRTPNDLSMANNFFSESKAKFTNIFSDFKAQYSDLITTGNNVNTLANLSGATVGGANTQLNSLSKKKTELLAEIKSYRRMSDSADKSFLEDIMHGTPQKELAPSLQDAVLLLFWFSWILISLTLVLVRWGSPGGGWRAGSFTLLLLFLVTLFLYALLNQVA
jgi:hypothetical protein